MSIANGIRRQSEAERPETPPFMDNGMSNLYAERENGIPNVMTSPALIPHSSYQDDGHLKNNTKKLKQFGEEDSLSDKSYSSNELPTPPDGGWGWAVVFASFMIHIIADGITYSFGIFVTTLLSSTEFKGTSHASVSFIPSILVGVTLGAGPIASSLTNRFGCRVVTIIGALIASIGLASSAAATSIMHLYITIGLVTGMGFGLIYLPAIVSVSMYFEKRRAFATGIAVCGSGFGTFIMAPVTTALVDHFNWNGAFLIFGAIVLLNIIFGAMFRPLLPSSNASETTTTSNQDAVNVDDARSSFYKISEKENGVSLNNSFTNGSIPVESISQNGSFVDCENNSMNSPEIKLNGEPLRPMAMQWAGLGHHIGTPEGKYSEFARMALSHPVLPSQPLAGPMDDINGAQSFTKIYENRADNSRTNRHHSHHSRRNSGVMFRKDILYGGSLYNIPEYKSNPRRYSRHLSVKSYDERRTLENKETCTDGGTNQDKICGCIPAGLEASKAFKEMVDFSLLKDGIFIMFAISNFLTSIGFNVPYVYTADRAKKFGFSDGDASVLLMVIGIANTVGRLVLGYISDHGWVKRLYLYNICLAICGLAIGLSNFCTDVHTQWMFCAVFGITSGAYVGLTSVVLVDLLGLDKLTNAFGLLLLFQGIASVMGPPIIGWLYDATGSYDIGFYFAGVMIFLSGVMLFAIPWMEKKRENDNREDGFGDIEHYANHEERILEVDEDDEEDPDDKPMTMKA